MEGFRLLLENNSCNLAWRVLFEAGCDRTGASDRFEQVMKQSLESGAPFKDLLSVGERRPIRRVRAALRRIIKGEDIEREALDEVFDALGYDPVSIARSEIRDELVQESAHKNIYKNTPIKIVTTRGAKGLTRDYAFLVNFDDRFLLERDGKGPLKITDDSVCRFLVSLTRARRQVSIYTSRNEYPTYVRWIADGIIDDRT